MIKFKKCKGFILGFSTCLLLGSAVLSVNASSVSKQLTAYYNNIKLVVAGEEVIPKDANGKVVEPFVIDGTTYLPVRAVGEALGQAVSWDGATNTVYIGESKSIGQPTVWMNKLDTLSGRFYRSFEVNGVIKDNMGKSYDNYLAQMAESEATYALNGQYSKFNGTLILTDSGKDTNVSYRLKVILDDKEVYVSEPITKNSFPMDFEIDVKNGMKMMLIWENDYNSQIHKVFPDSYRKAHANSEVAIVNPGLWK